MRIDAHFSEVYSYLKYGCPERLYWKLTLRKGQEEIREGVVGRSGRGRVIEAKGKASAKASREDSAWHAVREAWDWERAHDGRSKEAGPRSDGCGKEDRECGNCVVVSSLGVKWERMAGSEQRFTWPDLRFNQITQLQRGNKAPDQSPMRKSP